LKNKSGLRSARQEIPPFYRTWRFITVFTKARHQPLSWARWIQSTPPNPISIGKGKMIPLHVMEALGERGGIAPIHS
jgi:hypothetical protein